jgi:DNA-directed RNA polymerase subunit RPC12/RpoP
MCHCGANNVNTIGGVGAAAVQGVKSRRFVQKQDLFCAPDGKHGDSKKGGVRQSFRNKVYSVGMQYVCANCLGKPEEIIGDNSPNCLRCGKPMTLATLSYKGLWLSPSFIIRRMQKIIETHGTRDDQSSRRFKREREAWTTAVWALGLTQIDGREHWVEIETEDDTPDTKVHRLDQSNGHNKIETYNVEVVDWEQHVDDLIQIVRQKCAKAYPFYFWLVILGRSGKAIDQSTVVEAVRNLRVPFVEIWIVGRTLDNRYRMQLVRLFPDRADVVFDLRDAVRRSDQQAAIMRPGKRGTGTDLRPLGDVFLPIP